jgi:5-methylcytosine-specific restriction endonuclease McrA
MENNTMLCYRECGLVGTYTNKSGLLCCYKSAMSCPIVKRKAGENSGKSRKGKSLTVDHRNNISKSNLRHSVSEESKEKIRISNKKFFSENKRVPWNKGKTGVQTPWNKGKTGYSMPSRRKISEEDYQNYQKYKRAVYTASRKTYKLHEHIINPNKLLLGRSGTESAHQIDHKIPVSYGYNIRIPVHVMADVENLQLLSWKDNLKKSNIVDLDEQLLTNLLIKYKIELTQIRG